MRTLLVTIAVALGGCTAAMDPPRATGAFPGEVRLNDESAHGAEARTDVTGTIDARLAPVEGAQEEARRAVDSFAYWDDDRDGALTADELTDTMIAAWDEDADGVVARAEWPG